MGYMSGGHLPRTWSREQFSLSGHCETWVSVVTRRTQPLRWRIHDSVRRYNPRHIVSLTSMETDIGWKSAQGTTKTERQDTMSMISFLSTSRLVSLTCMKCREHGVSLLFIISHLQYQKTNKLVVVILEVSHSSLSLFIIVLTWHSWHSRDILDTLELKIGMTRQERFFHECQNYHESDKPFKINMHHVSLRQSVEETRLGKEKGEGGTDESERSGGETVWTSRWE